MSTLFLLVRTLIVLETKMGRLLFVRPGTRQAN